MSFNHLKALSVLQPWAWLLSNAIKDVENRSWFTRFRGDFLIHAGKKWGPEQRDDLQFVRTQFPDIVLPDSFDLGGIVGKACLIDCVDRSSSPWFFGKYGFVVSDAIALPFTPCKGALQFFDLPEGVDIPVPVAAPAPSAVVVPAKEEPWGMIERRPSEY